MSQLVVHCDSDYLTFSTNDLVNALEQGIITTREYAEMAVYLVRNSFRVK